MTTPFDQFLRDIRNPEVVRLTIKAEVNGEKVQVRQVVAAAALEDPPVREHIERQLREELVREILKKYKPAIRIER
jgi:hypothetical protein